MGTLRIDRRYTLGDYKYLTLDNTIDVDDGKEVNQALLLLITFDIIHRSYMKLQSLLSEKDTIDDALELLNKLRDYELAKLNEKLGE